MASEQLDALRKASQDDPELHAALEAAGSVEEWVAIAKQRGFAVEVDDVAVSETGEREVSDAELETVSGGYTFPHSIYCDTFYVCSLRC